MATATGPRHGFFAGLVFVLLAATDGSSHAQTTAPSTSVETLIADISAIEATLQNIRIECEIWHEKRLPGSNEWERTQVSCASTAWYSPVPVGKARVDVHRQVLEWKNGAAPFGEDSFAVGFDGQHGREVRHSGGAIGDTFRMKRAEIDSERPGKLTMEWRTRSTGAFCSTFFHYASEGVGFAQALQLMVEQKVSVRVEHDVIDGHDCVLVTVGAQDSGVYESFWLEPSRGYALRRWERTSQATDGNPVVVSRFNVFNLVEAAKGIWYPSEVINSAGSADQRTHYRASAVVANDPEFDDTVFTVPIPAGYRVDDKVRGVKYKMQRASPKYADVLNDTAAETRPPATSQAEPSEPATNAASATHGSEASAEDDTHSGSPAASLISRRGAWLLSIAVVVLAVGGLLARRRHSTTSTRAKNG